VGHGRLEAARLLLEGGADPSLAAHDGITPLMIAVIKGQLEVLRLLLARGAAVDAKQPESGCTVFHYACFHNQPECAAVLARAGCNVGITNHDGATGREMAEAEGHAAVVARLQAVVVGGEPPEPEEPADPAPAQLLIATTEGDGAALARLLATGADPNSSLAARNVWGGAVQTTALCEAAGRDQLEAALGLGRIVALYCSSSTSYQIH
jgi:hypothetical protein